MTSIPKQHSICSPDTGLPMTNPLAVGSPNSPALTGQSTRSIFPSASMLMSAAPNCQNVQKEVWEDKRRSLDALTSTNGIYTPPRTKPADLLHPEAPLWLQVLRPDAVRAFFLQTVSR